MAKLYRPGGPPDGVPVAVSSEASALVADPDDGAGLALPYDGLRGRLVGYEDAWVVFVSDDAPGVELWVEPGFVRGPMAARRDDFGGPFGDRFDELLGLQRRRATTRGVASIALRGGRLALRLGVVVALVVAVIWALQLLRG